MLQAQFIRSSSDLIIKIDRRRIFICLLLGSVALVQLLLFGPLFDLARPSVTMKSLAQSPGLAAFSFFVHARPGVPPKILRSISRGLRSQISVRL
jgi:hypothetical protein